ncbi:hypothetical protein V6Z11_A07G067200 [Gossypium hirsutum]
MVLTIDIVMITIAGAMKDLVSLYGPWKQALAQRRRPNILGKTTMKGKQDQLLVEGVRKSRFQIFEDNGDENEVGFDKEIEDTQMKNKAILKWKESRREILKGSNSKGVGEGFTWREN